MEVFAELEKIQVDIMEGGNIVKRVLRLLPLILIILLGFGIAKAGKPLKLSGKITNIEMKDKVDSVVFSVKVKMSFETTGDEAVLLLKDSYPASSPYAIPSGTFFCTYFKISDLLKSEKDKRVLYSPCALPSIEATPAWQSIKSELDTKTPPLNRIQIIKKGESFDFESNWVFTFMKKRDSSSYDSYNAIWSEIKNAESLSLELGYRIWSLELEPRSAKREERPFGKKLQKRWKKYGYLRLDDIVSEPIPLDLSAAVVKANSQR